MEPKSSCRGDDGPDRRCPTETHDPSEVALISDASPGVERIENGSRGEAQSLRVMYGLRIIPFCRHK